jgi:hypothetical protein
MWRERYEVQLITGVIITCDGRIILPAHPPQES